MSRPGVMRFSGIAKFVFAAALLSVALSGPVRADVSFSFFYSNLDPHGSWLVSAEYGQVWRPSVHAAGWHPYYDGHWVYTDVGWAWVSDYAWGAVPYHYGTWVFDPFLGWVWVPGYVWAPSWVVFRTGPDYIGWCPVPAGYSVGASFSFGAIPAGRFVFVGARDFLAPRVRGHAIPASRTKVIFSRTKVVNRITVRNDVVVNHGPDVRIVEKARGRRVEAVPIERVRKIAPTRTVRREHLRVDPEARRAGLRAAEPRSAKATARRKESAPRDATLHREGTVRREPAVRRQPIARSEAPERGVSKRKPEGEQVAKPREKGTKKPEKNPPARKPKDDKARGGGSRGGSR